MPGLALSIVICTRNRAESLRETLESLLHADATGISFEVIAVDNGSTDDTPAVVAALRPRLAIRYLFEPVANEGGKGRSLNRAIGAGALGRMVAVIDDDISVAPGWLQGVMALGQRWPDYDFFAGPVRPGRPVETLPGWVRSPRIGGWALSVLDLGPRDVPLRDGGAFTGNHFWFRSAVLTEGVRFEETWLTEPTFYNELLGRGHRGIYGPDAAVTHRFQDELLEPARAIERAARTGTAAARMRLQPYRPGIKAARLCRRHPLLARLFCLAQVIRWGAVRVGGGLGPRDARIRRRILAAQGAAYYAELLRLCRTGREYRIFGYRGARPASVRPRAEPGSVG